jgi:TatD DNase family protein
VTDRPVLIDAHAHLDHYGDGLDEAMAEIESHRILTVAVAMDPASYEKNREIAARCPLVIPAFGVHPWNAAEYAHRLDELEPSVAGCPLIGEIGLDHHFVTDRSLYPSQREVFDFLMAAARRHGLIVNLHTKGAERDVLDTIVRHDVRPGIVHWYSGPAETMKGYFDRGFLFTVGVEILVSDRIARIAAKIPDDLLLTETDNPGGYEWYTKVFGKPSIVTRVIERLAEARKTSPGRIEEIVRGNFSRLVGGDERLRPWAPLVGGDS